jgi:hypothetical protein
MCKKKIICLYLSIALIGFAILMIPSGEPIYVYAQCGDAPTSSCSTCHAQEDPVNEKGKWHIIHASKDICMNCHGGNGSTMDKDLAHEGLMAHPLDDIYTDCHSCHPDYDERAAHFAPTLGVTPGSCATSTPVPVGNISGEPPSDSINIPNNVMNTTPSQQPFVVIGTMLGILALFLLGIGWLERHHVEG